MKAVDESVLEWRRVERKEQRDGTKTLKKLFEQRKMLLKPCCLLSRHSEARKAAAQAVKMSKEHSLKKFGRRLDFNNSSASTLFWQTIRACVGKTQVPQNSIKDSDTNILRDGKEILLRWREYFKDLLNPVRATPTGTWDAIDFGKEEAFTLTEVEAATQRLNFRKAVGKDQIRSEMLKTLNGCVLWLIKMCQVAWELEKTLKD